MINLIIKDGLGNQMFQYAYARWLQEQYKQKGIIEPLVINPYFIQHKDFRENDARDMSLHHLCLNEDVTIQNRKDQKRSFSKFRMRTIFSTSPIVLFNWIVRKKKPLGESNFKHWGQHGIYYTFSPYTYYASPLSKKKVKYVFGFFQDERNFRAIADTIKKELLVSSEPTRQNVEMLEAINATNAVCLHIRRGDYLNPRWKGLQICNYEYYNNAINYILDRVENPVFYVFSNTHKDLEWIKSNYKFKDTRENRKINLVFVDLENPDYEELRLMYNCKYFIISNSTFSWWAAYLSQNNEKIVLVPERWNLASEMDYTIYLKDWIKIKNK